MLSTSPLRLAFVGCGRISSKHFDALDALQDQIQVTALCDSNIQRAQQAREQRACCAQSRVYQSIKAMLGAEQKLHAATIALPNGLHAKAGSQCARAGIHVIVEKPLAVRLSDGRRLVQNCREQGVNLFLIHQNRFNAPIQYLYRAVRAGRLGRIYSIHANVFWTRSQSYYDSEAAWHGTRSMDGGAFYTQASHYLDMVQWLAGGRPRRLYGQLRTLARKIETEDCGTVFLEWGEPGSPDNLIATLNMSMLSYPRNFEGSVLVLGETGCVKIGGTAMNKVEHWNVVPAAGEQQTGPEGGLGSYDTQSVYGFGHRNLYSAVAAKLAGRPLPAELDAALVYGENVLDNLVILDGIHRSARENRMLELG